MCNAHFWLSRLIHSSVSGLTPECWLLLAVSLNAFHAAMPQGCMYCGGLGHRITNCPKLESQNKLQERAKKDYFGAKGGMGAES